MPLVLVLRQPELRLTSTRNQIEDLSSVHRFIKTIPPLPGLAIRAGSLIEEMSRNRSVKSANQIGPRQATRSRPAEKYEDGLDEDQSAKSCTTKIATRELHEESVEGRVSSRHVNKNICLIKELSELSLYPTGDCEAIKPVGCQGVCTESSHTASKMSISISPKKSPQRNLSSCTSNNGTEAGRNSQERNYPTTESRSHMKKQPVALERSRPTNSSTEKQNRLTFSNGVIRGRFFLKDSAGIEKILTDPSDRRLQAVCERFQCFLEVFSKTPKNGFMQYTLDITAPNRRAFMSFLRTLDSKMHWCLVSQIR
ncbi:unnamed protein product [Protopolystoma xenopodis]|uniref:Uncharacterized protein n=1 Tax=Protopolystoma xenopodis TaxID=117903 RepID=A0A448XD50_9PLAT|nr:unnamed protein product [Protopolystoma xenopodis]